MGKKNQTEKSPLMPVRLKKNTRIIGLLKGNGAKE